MRRAAALLLSLAAFAAACSSSGSVDGSVATSGRMAGGKPRTEVAVLVVTSGVGHRGRGDGRCGCENRGEGRFWGSVRRESGGERGSSYEADTMLAVRHGVHEGYERVVLDLGTGEEPTETVTVRTLMSPWWTPGGGCGPTDRREQRLGRDLEILRGDPGSTTLQQKRNPAGRSRKRPGRDLQGRQGIDRSTVANQLIKRSGVPTSSSPRRSARHLTVFRSPGARCLPNRCELPGRRRLRAGSVRDIDAARAMVEKGAEQLLPHAGESGVRLALEPLHLPSRRSG